ncbi:hypothetical protein A3H10_02315 [Candidatus Uhrbacteria bacterium RIFCSPLOWO2_12_FULL_46_10]|uniref:Uncharacterized protein n=1 Tax=Candidatus Uhrbacteria bacterium RIFCSPLOWO2_01_FULL_47_25 TaxID=1802402 RepID=A0A1F7UTL2_9BACT|nr:MAG: hypothetical protein UX68_C0012G0030 [Parcubacteria group bacterium GW2011_GWA2_46_9]OGL61240.1 MAG: hypothetical protein A2752_00110 [Candidatus Uhrbacteria bacterium RIFCSPHIGHO2_01_FULL_46_23]OGL68360.1 MAG: hypothetical protein A3D60_00610 [Candidatus Uhrbacteria bacterium RIFCSPHIGHO2_02_FULL_47_29]OGL75046.1 MAG: hypothetical protein A3E96_00230 [Candidatus Uhrbacteria bacterium RIFCSPHIGHO2_12_FULL_46_13]OGL81048.1 MAG: hypothetical protein A2936_00415 [Candidatus Uhrbacteria bac
MIRENNTILKIGQSKSDLVTSLERHLRLLVDYHKKAFEENNKDYCGEIAGKLRLLVIESNNPRSDHKPLLLELIKKYGSREVLESLKNKINNNQLSFITSTGKHLTLKQLIWNWANQAGAGHEDLKLEPNFGEVWSMQQELNIHGRFPLANSLEEITEYVIEIGKSFLWELKNNEHQH